MTKDEIRRMMALVDEAYIDELTNSHDPAAPFPAENQKQPLQKHSFPWRAVTGIAAAFVILVPVGLLTRQVWENRNPVPHSDPQIVLTATSVTETEAQTETLADDTESETPFASLAEANAAEYPWQGNVVQAQSIGTMAYDGAFRSRLSYTDTVDNAKILRDAVHVVYKDPDDSGHYAHIQYTRAAVRELTDTPEAVIRAEMFCTLLLHTSCTDTAHITWDKETGNGEFIVNCGNYRICSVMQGCTRQEVIDLITGLYNGINAIAHDEVRLPDEPDDGSPAVDDLTYAQAKLFAGRWLPEETMGWEEPSLPHGNNLMTFQSAVFHQSPENMDNDSAQSVTHEINKWLEITYEGENGSLQLTLSEPGVLEKYSFTDHLPELDSNWSRKITDQPPYGIRLTNGSVEADGTMWDDGRFAYHFWTRFKGIDIILQAECSGSAFDPFCEFYNGLNLDDSGYQTRHLRITDVNDQLAEWKGEVITAESIGDLKFDNAYMTKSSMDPTNPDPCLFENLTYTDVPRDTCGITLSYTDATSKEMCQELRVIAEDALDADTLLNDTRFDAGDQRIFLIDRGEYRVMVRLSGSISRDTLDELIALLRCR